jgi:5-methylcytosine-specific restriction endonuclease McrA
MSDTLRSNFNTKTVLDLKNLYENGSLNLEPGFQRKSVWSDNDRKKLIQSVLENYPVPSIFLYRREESGRLMYDVIDGKQRLESIFRFCGAKGFKGKRFAVRHQFEDDEKPLLYDWRDLGKWHLGYQIDGYEIQTVEVAGDLADIVDLFIRINSTGKALTRQEKVNARYYRSPYLKEARRIARKLRRYFQSQRILRQSQIQRMRDVELVSELLASILAEGPVDKKAAIDKAIGNETIHARTLTKAGRELLRAIDATKRILPEVGQTRFRNSSEFYSLVLVVWEMQKERLVLTDRERNEQARNALVGFSNRVDKLREADGSGRGALAAGIDGSYLLATLQGTDKRTQRNARHLALRKLLSGLFDRKDSKRIFPPEVRRLLWNSQDKKVCSVCDVELDWTNFEVDHKQAWSTGGRTRLSNAALICSPCNQSKGAGRAKKRRTQGRTKRGTRRRAA